MRHAFLASASVFALGFAIPASAADLPAKARPLAPEAISSWAGFYLGIHGGYGWRHNPFTDLFNGVDPIGGINSRGELIGGHAGHNWQYDRIVGGLEIDLSAADIKGSTSFSFGDSGSFTLQDRVTHLGSARAQLGVLPTDNVLVYGTTGLAWERLKRTETSHAVQSNGNSVIFTGTTPTDHFGWTAGAGIEAKLYGNWLGRIEYLHYDFGKSATVEGESTSGRQTIDVVRAGLSYKFDAPSAGRAIAVPRLVKAAPAGLWSWAGFYLGAHGGYGWANDPFGEPFTGPNDTFTTIGGIHSRGWLIGGHAGHNWQYGNLVTGLEVDLSATNIKGTTSASLTDGETTQTGTRRDHVEYLGTLRARLGVLPTDGVLVYGTAGLAWERLQRTEIFVDDSSDFSRTSRTPIDRFGWVAGVGAETRLFGSNWIGRFEYLHYDFGRLGTSETIQSFDNVVLGETRNTASNQTVDVIRAGLSYKFGSTTDSVTVMPVKATPTAAWTWAGFYLGVHGGHGRYDNPIGQTFAFDLDPSADFEEIQSAPVGPIRARGWLLGGHAGYNWQFQQIVVGTEIDFTAADMNGSTSAVLFKAFTPSDITRTVEFTLQDRVKYLGSARARLGVLPTDGLLLYGTAGLGWERLERTDTFTDTTFFGALNRQVFSNTQPVDRFGWVAGAGVEARLFGSNWLGRVEYLRYDFGSFAANRTIDVVGGVSTVSDVESSGRQTIDVVRAGISYKFGPN